MSINEHNTGFGDGCDAVFNSQFETGNGGTVNRSYVESIVKEYIEHNTIPAGVDKYVTVYADKWVADGENKFSQVVEVEGITEKSDLIIKISAEQLEKLYPKSLSFVACNENGVVTIYAVGQNPPQNDYVIQINVSEVR
jgi:hypothetical protein